GLDVGSSKERELRHVAVWLFVVRAAFRRSGLFIVDVHKGIRREVAIGPLALQLVIDHPSELFNPNAVHEELEAGLCAVLTELIGSIEDVQNCFGKSQVFVDRNKLAQDRRVSRHDAEPAANDNFESLPAILNTGDEA